MQISRTCEGDLPGLRVVLDSIELFPAEMLADLIAPFLAGSGGDDLWLTCRVDGQISGLCFARLEALTNGTWNMLALGVLSAQQGRGLGTGIVAHLEASLRDREARVMIVDTSSKDAFAQARTFYRKAGYAQVAVIPDFWDAGDDKVIFHKAL